MYSSVHHFKCTIQGLVFFFKAYLQNYTAWFQDISITPKRSLEAAPDNSCLPPTPPMQWQSRIFLSCPDWIFIFSISYTYSYLPSSGWILSLRKILRSKQALLTSGVWPKVIEIYKRQFYVADCRLSQWRHKSSDTHVLFGCLRQSPGGRSAELKAQTGGSRAGLERDWGSVSPKCWAERSEGKGQTPGE